ncbi:cation transport ATPase [Dongia mobilis]|uniref:Cation transport ATPase n=1 Tax=Dongia mobilis TaxID=578943 RepID=A0A4R6WNJ3_9PROT|nr:cation-translocating P-type ATPase [Dongia mobilis]TDQ77719.1 cation transport ATPase [Dongia mobilis]
MAWQGLQSGIKPRDAARVAILLVPLVILGLSGDWWDRSPLLPVLHVGWAPVLLAAIILLGFGWPLLRRAISALLQGKVRGETLLVLGAGCGLALAVWQLSRLGPESSHAAQLLLWRDAAFAASLVAVSRLGDIAARADPIGSRAGARTRPPSLTIAAGDLIPVDAVVRDGRSEIQDPHGADDIFPTVVGPGDRVHAGSRNGDAALVVVPLAGHRADMAATARPPADGGLAALIGWASIGVMVLIVLALVWRLLVGPALRDPPGDILRLVMLSAPLGLGLAMTAPAAELLRVMHQLGIEVHRIGVFEHLLKVGAVVFGHSGVLIPDRHRVVSVQTPDGEGGSELVGRAASVAQAGHDPWGRALLDLAVGYRMRLKNAINYRAEIGKGIAAEVMERRTLIGSRAYLEEHGIDCRALDGQAEAALAQGRRLRWAGEIGPGPKNEPRLLGFIAFGAPSVAGAAMAVKNLDRLGLKTGWVADQADPAHQAMARHLKLGAMLPMAPAAAGPALADLRRHHGPLLYVTSEPDADDVIAALAPGDIVLPFGRRAATQAPMADFAIARQDPRLVVDLQRYAQRYCRLVKMNIAIVFAVSLVVAFWPFLQGSARDLASYEAAVILLLVMSSLSLRALPSTANEIDEE